MDTVIMPKKKSKVSEIEFVADIVELTVNTGFVGLSMSTGEHYFWMQPSETAKGICFDKSKIWIERDDQQFGGTGKTWSIELSRDVMILNADSLKRMGCQRLLIHFNIPSQQHKDLLSIIQSNMRECLNDLTV